MTTVTATEENFSDLVDHSDIVVVDFWAEWCGPCRGFAPVFEAASTTHPDVVFAKINTDEQQGLARAFGVRGIPMVAVFRQQVLLYAESGALPAAALEQLITQAKALDMDAVRADIATEKAARSEQDTVKIESEPKPG